MGAAVTGTSMSTDSGVNGAVSAAPARCTEGPETVPLTDRAAPAIVADARRLTDARIGPIIEMGYALLFSAEQIDERGYQ
jgi:hypothetical protein